MDLERMKAEFAARGGQVAKVEAAPAYGVDPAVDRERAKQRRAEARAERDAERRMEDVREAYHVGGRRAAYEAMCGDRGIDGRYGGW